MSAAQSSSLVEVGGQRIRVSNLDKVLYPATDTSKGEVLAYYQSVSAWMLPHVRWRPATRKRWPNGVGTATTPGDPFFHKGLDERSTPDWIRIAALSHDDGEKFYPLVNDAATLVWLAQLAALEIHVPQWRFSEQLVAQNPDRLVLDLDPGAGATMEQCVELAHLLREVLQGAGMPCIPVTSGSKGIHLYVALDGSLTSAEVCGFARKLATSLEAMRPDLVVSDMKKALREGKVLLDWSQNNSSKTTIAPYSLRGKLRPTVAVPRTWEELTPEVEQLEFTDVLLLVEKRGDPLLALWQSNAPATRPLQAVHGARSAVAPSPQAAPSVELKPMLATAGTLEDVRTGEWTHEIKWDGYRALATLRRGELRLTGRSGRDLTSAYPELADLTAITEGRDAILDGEIVVLDDQGVSKFGLLQNHPRSGQVHYMAFDLLELDGASLVELPHVQRRALLEQLIPLRTGLVQVPDTLATEAAEAFATSEALGMEGIVSKASSSLYEPGRRSSSWIKIKHVGTQEAVVIGWAPGRGARRSTLGSVLLAVHDGDGALRYVGKAGSGFSDEGLAQAREVLEGIAIEHSSALDVPRSEAGARWVEPLLVGEVSFAEWTDSARLRQPVWRGWRPDKRAEDVRRE